MGETKAPLTVHLSSLTFHHAFNEILQRKICGHSNLLAEAVAQHKYATGCDSHKFGNALVVLLEDDEHGEEFFSAGNGGHFLTQAGEKERIEQFEALAEL